MNILLVFDEDIEMDKHAFVTFLNERTEFVKFELFKNSIFIPEELMTKPESFEYVREQLFENDENFDRVFCFTDKQYIDNYFMHEHNDLTIFSFFGWEFLTNLPITNGALHFITHYLALDIDKSDFRHVENTGCTYDFFYNKKGIDPAMRQAGFCSNCSQRISEYLVSENDYKIFNDLKNLLNILSESSRWNSDILSAAKKTANNINKRRPKQEGVIHVVIASPSDTAAERKMLLDSLEVKFRRDGHESHCGYRIIVNGWEDLASQPGYPQDIINEKIIKESDFVVTIFKHKLGTPTIDSTTNLERYESGTVEELFQALDKSKSDQPIGMAYFYSTAPIISLDAPEKNKIESDWERLSKFKNSLKNKLIFKPYTDGNDLMNLILKDLEHNIIDYISK